MPRKNTDGLEILVARSRRVRQMVAEERVNFRAAGLIRRAREETGLTQADLAAKVGTTQSVISRLEDADYAGHTLGTLQRILAALGRNLVLGLEPAGSRRQEAKPWKPNAAGILESSGGEAMRILLEERAKDRDL